MSPIGGPSALYEWAHSRDLTPHEGERAVILLAMGTFDERAVSCRFDHHGGCQAHGYLDIRPGESCGIEEVRQFLVSVGWDDAQLGWS